MDAPTPPAAPGDTAEPGTLTGRIADIPIALIDARPDQPRQRIGGSSLRELTASVRVHGILQPIRVRPRGQRYEIIAGARRFSAARDAGLRTIPAIVVDVGDDEAYVEALVENVQREDLNAVDRAHALMRLRVSLGIQTWEEVGNLIGIRRAHVYRLLNTTKLPEVIRDDIRHGALSEKHGRALLSLRAHPTQQLALWDRIRTEHLSGDDAIRLASSYRRSLSRTGAATDQAEAAPEAPDAAVEPATVNGLSVPRAHEATAPEQTGEPEFTSATATPELAAPTRQGLVQAVRRATQALAAATPEDCVALHAELRRLEAAVRAALREDAGAGTAEAGEVPCAARHGTARDAGETRDPQGGR
jgi:ParB family transcriptional regulator, chromosome partitioning protein